MLALLPVREIGKPTDRDHHVEQRHVFAVGQDLRLGSFADDPDLLAARPDEGGDDHGHHRIPNVLGQRLLEVASERGRRLAQRLRVIDQRRRDLAVRPPQGTDIEFRVPPNDDIDGIQRSDDVVVVRRRCVAWRRWIGGRGAAAPPTRLS